LLDYGTKRLLEIEGLKIFGTAKRKPLISFNIEGIHPYDIDNN
jgi:cysteine desulfurase/selenocysteine lyase